ncbi:hypothetical protein CR532_00960 [Candidatus Borreliella tachyglossi]|uniref:Lipoprotein n=1 Tax=Candidatus Borreliella tachyglossi TaxID=1964448 RepID=A0A2S1LWC0_9SPIR|nr:hypothetical protein [Candidatus Borreliella tachyglossi]AWG42582.1 hypothetical protein CR532_00960 [Candidatus Borreliella tachyglossi]
MLKTKKPFIILSTLILLFSCQENKIINQNFDYIIIFSDSTEYFFEMKATPFIEDKILFINEKDIGMIKDHLNNAKKILLTYKSTNKIFNEKKIREKLFNLSDVKFSLKKAIDFILIDPSVHLTTSLIMADSSLNKEDLEHLQKHANEIHTSITMIDSENIQYLKNFITPKITRVILFSMKNNHTYLKRFSVSPFFKKIDFILIGNIRKDLKEINAKYVIGINELDLIEIIKKINKNFHYEFNIYKR